MTEPSRDLLEYYSRRAPEYEGIYEKPERQEDLARLREAVAEEARGQDVLEIACGTGYWTRVIAPVARTVVAADASEETIAVARAQHGSLPPVRYEVRAIEELETLEGEFTLLLGAFYWSHVDREELPAFLVALHRRLGPGVRLVFLDNRFFTGSSTPLLEEDSRGNTFQLRHLLDGSSYRILKNFPDEAEITRLLAPHARDIRVTELRYFWMVTCTTAPV